LVICGARDANASRFGQALEACGNIDPIAIDLLPLHNHVPQIDADAKFYPAVDWQFPVSSSDLPLDCYRTEAKVMPTAAMRS
jgi:hypothetical protein